MLNHAIKAGQFTRNQLREAGIMWDNKELPELLDQAGGGLSVGWLERLAVGLVGKITIRHAIGLRRLLGVPVDTIIGLEYTHPANRDKMAGLARIRHELGGRKPLTHKNLLDRLGCSAPITRRIELFSTWAVLNKAADIETPAGDIARALQYTFSIPILISLKWAIHNNIDDILGLGDYDPAIFADNTPTAPTAEEVQRLEIVNAEEKKAHDEKIIAQFATSRAASQPDAVTGFRPKAVQ